MPRIVQHNCFLASPTPLYPGRRTLLPFLQSFEDVGLGFFLCGKTEVEALGFHRGDERLQFVKLEVHNHVLASGLDLLDDRQPLHDGRVVADAMHPLDRQNLRNRQDPVQMPEHAFAVEMENIVRHVPHFIQQRGKVELIESLR